MSTRNFDPAERDATSFRKRRRRLGLAVAVGVMTLLTGGPSGRGDATTRPSDVMRTAEQRADAMRAEAMSTTQPATQPMGESPGRYAGFDGYRRTVTTASAEAQAWFDQGIQLLYGYNHDEAIRSFERAAAIDPGCAMAWWGIAYANGLHINRPMMGPEQSKRAYDAAQKGLAALDNETPVEQAFVRAVAERYAWPAPDDRRPLDEKYAAAMEKAWFAFPDDPDMNALFAESLMDLQPWDLWTHEGAPKGRTLEVVAVLERAMRLAPQHPGLNHFYIHAIEASPWPERGTQAAERLATIVPGSGHLVHMPSHIFVRTGRYAESSDLNARAIAADERYFALAPPPDFYSLYFVHNLHMLAFSAMMEGRYQVAIDTARKLEQRIPAGFLHDYVKMADGFMPTALNVMVRFGKWDQILAEPEPPAWRLLSRCERHFARSVAFSAKGQTDEARQEIGKLDAVAAELTDDWFVHNNSAKTVVGLSRKMAEGELAFREGRRDEAFKTLREAVKIEETLKYDEPPGWMQPVRHALGALLLADGKAAEAEQVYREDLVRHPNNGWSLLGLRQSLAAQHRDDEAAALDAPLAAAWRRADVKPVASCYCHPDAREKGPAGGE